MNTNTCYLIGDDHLLIQCAETLIEHNFKIMGIISPLKESKVFADNNGIPYFDSVFLAESHLLECEFDYLFSIINHVILTKKIIDHANKMAINFHNSPLPAYAGVHVLSWALLNNEAEHGVTWHRITELIDGGNILKQALFPIAKDETGLSLSLKCYEFAISTFHELLISITSNTLKEVSQDLAKRTYTDFNKKPRGNAWISWRDNAEDIERMTRALNLGHYYHNRLSCPKFILGQTIYIITRLRVLHKKSSSAPGTIQTIDERGWCVNTNTKILRIEQIHNLEGDKLDLSRLAEQSKLLPGDILISPGESELLAYHSMSENCAKWELFWVKELRSIIHTSLPFQEVSSQHQIKSELQCISTLKLPQLLIESWENAVPEEYKPVDILLAGLLIYLYRLDHQETVGVGFHNTGGYVLDKVSSRFFATFIPFSLNFSNHDTILDGLKKMKHHQEKLTARLTYSRDVYFRYPELADAEKDEYPIGIVIGKEMLATENLHTLNANIILVLSNDGKEISWWTNTGFLDKQPFLGMMIKNSKEQLNVLFRSIVTYLNTSLVRIPILSADERQMILSKWSVSQINSVQKKSIVHFFEEQVARFTHNVALKYHNESLTYLELHQKSNQLAHYLKRHGLTKNEYAAICTRQESHLLIGILAILKTGSAYVPIDPSYPKHHINYVLSDCKPKLLLASEELIGKFDEQFVDDYQVIIFDEITKDIKKQSIENLDISDITPDTNAYVIYTSGTTGRPKGVAIPHKGVTRLVKNANYIKITEEDNIAQGASISFDAATFEIWGALLNGATLMAVPQETLLNIAEFGAFIEYNDISILWLTSALFNQYASKSTSLFKKLSYLLVGGDVLNKELIFSVLECREGRPKNILNGYGPTENTTFTTTHRITTKDKYLPSIPIGKPISNTSVFILDENNEPTPIGFIGELYTGGDGLTPGYLNRADLTDEKFIISSVNQTLLYRTGDRARWMPDGNIEYLGRADNQVKIRGYRVELEAIQAHLLRHGAITQSIVISDTYKHHKVLVAYLITTQNIGVQEIRDFLSKNLPNYMIPNYFIFLNEFPLNANGKIDIKKLPPRDFIYQQSDFNYIKPRTTLEQNLVKTWETLLGVHPIGVENDFFDLGGHSLLTTQLIMHIKETYHINISLPAFLEKPTIHCLAQLIRGNHMISSEHNKKLRHDAMLTHFVQLDHIDVAPTIPKAIFLTGASGFLGAYLLKDLYQSTNATIYCLIREKNIAEATLRLNNNLSRYEFDLCCNARIIPVLGDLALPKFGLTSSEFNILAKEIDLIYHNGAKVHHLYNYEHLSSTNVGSTLNIIQFASSKKLKPIHYVSTLSAANYDKDTGVITENYIFPDTEMTVPSDGYSQSKWVSEQLLAQASSRGIPVNIYRPGWIMGDSKTGVIASENNHLLHLIKGCIQLKTAPKWNLVLDILPVNLISQLITQISLKNLSTAHVFNLVNPNKISWHELIMYLIQRGYDITFVDENIWKNIYLSEIDQENALYSLYTLYMNGDEENWMEGLSQISTACGRNTEIAFEASKITPPEITHTLLNIYFDYLEKEKFLKKT